LSGEANADVVVVGAGAGGAAAAWHAGSGPARANCGSESTLRPGTANPTVRLGRRGQSRRQGDGLMSRFFFPRAIALAAFAVAMILFCGDALAGFAPPPVRPGSGTSSANASSWVAGGHAGYNWQQGAAVFGFATDLQATQLRTSVNAPLTYPTGGIILPTDLANTTSLVDWYGTLRGQLGVASGPWLLYGTAGLAYGHTSLSTLYRTAGLSLTGQISDVKTGWTAGAGFKYMMLPNLSVGFQYLYVDLGSIGLAGSTSASPVAIAFNSNANNRFQTATVGISWHFLPGSTAAPWQGAFAGIHGGGAWGNDTKANYIGTGTGIAQQGL